MHIEVKTMTFVSSYSYAMNTVDTVKLNLRGSLIRNNIWYTYLKQRDWEHHGST